MSNIKERLIVRLAQYGYLEPIVRDIIDEVIKEDRAAWKERVLERMINYHKDLISLDDDSDIQSGKEFGYGEAIKDLERLLKSDE